MSNLNVWDILGILAIILLLASFAIGKNAIWGTLTVGILICIVWAIVNLISGNPINWILLKK